MPIICLNELGYVSVIYVILIPTRVSLCRHDYSAHINHHAAYFLEPYPIVDDLYHTHPYNPTPQAAAEERT